MPTRSESPGSTDPRDQVIARIAESRAIMPSSGGDGNHYTHSCRYCGVRHSTSMPHQLRHSRDCLWIIARAVVEKKPESQVYEDYTYQTSAERLKASALAKLTDAERRVLGL